MQRAGAESAPRRAADGTLTSVLAVLLAGIFTFATPARADWQVSSLGQVPSLTTCNVNAGGFACVFLACRKTQRVELLYAATGAQPAASLLLEIDGWKTTRAATPDVALGSKLGATVVALPTAPADALLLRLRSAKTLAITAAAAPASPQRFSMAGFASAIGPFLGRCAR